MEAKVFRDLQEKLDQAEEQARKFLELSRESARLQEDVGKAIAAANKLLPKTSSGLSEDEAAQIKQFKDRISVVQSIQPMTGSVFLRLFLGKVNVRVFNPSDRVRLKNEYNKFKRRTTIIYLLLHVLMLVARHAFHWSWEGIRGIMFVTMLWFLYYNVSLALRENILRANGSNIREWWIWHHHIAALGSLAVVTWPTGGSIGNRIMPQSVCLGLVQGCVQLVQHRYQTRRHYVLRSLGKVGSMDVSHTETIIDSPVGLYRALLLMLLSVHAIQLYLAYTTASLFLSDLLAAAAAPCATTPPHVPAAASAAAAAAAAAARVCAPPPRQWWRLAAWARHPWQALSSLAAAALSHPECVHAPVTAAVFALFAVCNFTTTLTTVLAKSSKRREDGSKRPPGLLLSANALRRSPSRPLFPGGANAEGSVLPATSVSQQAPPPTPPLRQRQPRK